MAILQISLHHFDDDEPQGPTFRNHFVFLTKMAAYCFTLRIFSKVAREGKWNVSIENVTDETGVLSIVGPYARDVLAESVGDEDLVKNWKFLDSKKVGINPFFKSICITHFSIFKCKD